MINRRIAYQLFKYAVYALLTLNIFIFFQEEFAAAPHRFASGLTLADVIEAYSATIDTTAWVILLLMFELETFVLADHQFTRGVTLALQGFRAVCYTFIVYAFYGYVIKLVFLLGAGPAPDISNLCSIVSDQWAYVIDLDEYTLLTAANCATFSDASVFFQLPQTTALVDADGLKEIVRLAWADVINAGVWLLVVVLLEIDVFLQERNKLQGMFHAISTGAKFVLYSLLLLCAIYWGWKGDFVDFWDAFLWLVAFIFIELNVVEWREESLEADSTSGHRPLPEQH